ncbi:MAG: undecaprenyldiphospho-muramoylpentapeptide beta-N-acetylglucosaminyltransferase [Candidatus Schekmanbacteria bacterium]|nr:undecaprenyldiphospho-muramoylpentapeptide beta-N-acetylglucosaminyltransferase [Candidatus Schekmanbacteria bacterium]
MRPRILFAGGGTGGHIYPGIAVIDEIRQIEPGASIRWVGTARRMEATIIPKKSIPFDCIHVEGFSREKTLRALAHNALNMVRLATLGPLWEALRIIRRFRPNAVVATGGYVCGPVGLAARLSRVPLIVLEQNARPGLTTRLLSRVATFICVSDSETVDLLPRGARARALRTGNPIRRAIVEAQRDAARRRLRLADDKILVVVVGGSLGAGMLNTAVRGCLDGLQRWPEIELIHITGERYHAELESAGRGIANYRAVAYADNMPDLLAAAELVVARSGATTTAELTARGVPSILVPWPGAAANHQLHNAKAIADRGGAVLVCEPELQAQGLESVLRGVLSARDRWQELGRHAAALGRPEAALIVAHVVFTASRAAARRPLAAAV